MEIILTILFVSALLGQSLYCLKLRKNYRNKLDLRYKEQEALINLLSINRSSNIELKTKVRSAMKYIVSVPWIKLLSKGGVFLIENNQLKLFVSENLGSKIEELCNVVDKGHCLCGRAYESGQTIHAHCVDDRHQVRFDGMSPHGHYNIPIKDGSNVIGVLVLYLPHGHKKSQHDIDFLESCCQVLSSIISSHQNELSLISARESEATNALIITYNHEINNPLAIAKGSLKRIKNIDTEDKYFKRVDESLNRIEEIVKKTDKVVNDKNISFSNYDENNKMLKIS